MNSRFLILGFTFFLTTLISVLLSAPLWAGGGWSGTGGGSKTADQLNPWFLGEAPIEYCIISKNSLAPLETALDIMIRKNSRRWQDFFARYGLDQHGFGAGYKKFPDNQTRTVATRFVPAQDCRAVQSFCMPGQTDSEQCHSALLDKVLFLFGEPNDIVQEYLRTNGPMDGLAIRTEFNHTSFRSGGIIWIGNLESGGISLYSHLILHEMGHVLGMKHDSCWVMAENVVALFKSFNGLGEFQSIEAPNWPYSYQDQDRLIFTDARVNFGNTPGFYPNFILKYAGLLDLFSFAENNYFQVRGIVSKSLNSQSIELKIEIEELETKKIEVIQGRLQAKVHLRDPKYTPQLYTFWKNENALASPPALGLDLMDSGWVPEKLHGVLDWNGKKVAVDLDREKGMILSMFFPGASDYLTLATVQSSPSKKMESVRRSQNGGIKKE